jgi:hypothetical protein
MVGGLDLHRRQITFDVVELESGEEWRGRVWQPDRDRFRRWLRDDVTRRADGGAVALAVEGWPGWRYVVEEIAAAGFEAHLAEPAALAPDPRRPEDVHLLVGLSEPLREDVRDPEETGCDPVAAQLRDPDR